MNKYICILFFVGLFLLYDEVEGRGGGRGGGGNRGGGSKGGSSSYLSGGSSKGSSFGKGGSSMGGKTVVGTYKSFGAPSRWSVNHGRSYYFVGYPFGHRYYGYHSSRYKNELDDNDSKPEVMGATALLMLILFFIGLGVALYYTVICIQSRPNRRKQYSTSDRGHLLANDPDLNGNVDEEIPIDAVDSRPNNSDSKLDDDSLDGSATKENEMESLLLKSVVFQITPQCAAKDSKSVFIHIEDEPSPNETDSIRHIPPVNLSLASKYCNNSQLNEFLPQDNCSGTLSDSFEEDGLMVSRHPTSGTSISQLVTDSELNSVANVSLPSEGDSYYNLNKERKQVHFSSQASDPSSCETETAATIQHENQKLNDEKLPAIVSSQPSEDGSCVDYINLPNATSDHQFLPQLCHMPTSDPPYPISTSHPYMPLNSPDEQPKSDDYVIINPIYEQMQRARSNESINEDEGNVGNGPLGPLGWHVPMADKLSNDESHSKDTSVETVNSVPLEVLHAEHCDLQPPLRNDGCNKVKDAAADCVDSKPAVVKVLFPSDENVSGSSAFFLEKYSLSKDNELGADSSSSSSEPEVTEYSFITGPKVPSTALVLADEVCSYSDPTIIGIVSLNEPSVEVPENITTSTLIMEQPPTPISDENRSCSAQSGSSCNTRNISDIEDDPADENRTATNNTLNQLSRDDVCFTITNPNVLGTPPTTPPEFKLPSGFIIGNPTADLGSATAESLTDFIDVNAQMIINRERLSSGSSGQSSSSTSSSSSTNGSYKIQAKEDTGETEILKSDIDDKTKMPRLKK